MEQYIITEKCSTLRMLGREALKGRWKLAFAAMLIFCAAVYIPSLVLSEMFKNMPAISSIYSILIAGPLSLGYAIFALRLFRNDGPGVGQIFYGFERFGKSLALYLLISLFVFLWALIIVPGIILAVFVHFFIPFVFLLAIPAILAGIRYSQAFYILADHPEMGAMSCIESSKTLMAGNKMKYFLLNLSFIGWGALACIPVMAFTTIITKNALQAAGPGALTGPLAGEMLVANSLSFGSIALMLVSSLGLVVLKVYMMAAMTGFYEVASGNLRPGYITSTAEIIDGAEQAKEEDL